MQHELETFADDDSVATGAAEFIADEVRRRVAASGHFRLAASGGTTPWAMFAKLAAFDLPWEAIEIYQVDERVAPIGDPSRNLTNLSACFAPVDPKIVAMPVESEDLAAALVNYGYSLPRRFDLIHLGLGPDGHTASLVPGDRVLEVADRLVALTQPYQGHRRMTLTYSALARADLLLWVITGAEKERALVRLLRGDTAIPAGRVVATRSVVMTDCAVS